MVTRIIKPPKNKKYGLLMPKFSKLKYAKKEEILKIEYIDLDRVGVVRLLKNRK